MRRLSPTWAHAVLLALVPIAASTPCHAQSAPVPERVQAELVAKVCAYDKNFAGRAGAQAVVLVTFRSDNVDSSRSATQMMAALGDLPLVARLPHVEQLLPFTDAAALATVCRERHVAIVYVAPGLEEQVPGIAAALDGVDVLSVAAMPRDVSRGVVLGFDIFEGRPKLLLNLTQARKERVAFRPELVRLMTVVP